MQTDRSTDLTMLTGLGGKKSIRMNGAHFADHQERLGAFAQRYQARVL